MTTPLTTEQLEAIRERLRRATPGPWIANETYDSVEAKGGDLKVCDVNFVPGDMHFIAHAPTDINALLAEVERLRSERDARPAITPEGARVFVELYDRADCPSVITDECGPDEFPHVVAVMAHLREHARKVRT